MEHHLSDRFRPVSPADFSRYAKNLAWLTELPLQRSQELLARIYGYSDTHELQQVMAALADVPRPASALTFNWAGQWDTRTLNLVAAAKGFDSLDGLSPRDWEVRDIGLFEDPPEHRALFRVIKLKQELLAAIETDPTPATHPRAPQEYATLGRTLTDEEYVLHFTEIGSAVFKAIRYVASRSTWQQDELRYSAQTVADKLLAIADLHPNNPWPHAALACFVGGLFDGPIDNPEAVFEAAGRAVALFEEMYDGHALEAPEACLVTYNADTFYWPAALYWGGVAALQCGQTKIGRRWLRANRKISPRDEFGVRFIL